MAENVAVANGTSDTVSTTKDPTVRVAKRNGNAERLDCGLHVTQDLRDRTKAKIERESTPKRQAASHRGTKGGAHQEVRATMMKPDSTVKSVSVTNSRRVIQNRKTTSGLEKESRQTVIDKNLIRDGGSGKKGLVNTHCPSRGEWRLANASSGNYTVDTQKNPMEHLDHLDIGDDSRVELLDITSKLFPSGTEVESSQCDASCLLKDIELAEQHFRDLVMWFTTFETTKARNVIGFDLAMELCACYNLMIQRVAMDFKSAFENARFIHSILDASQAEETLQCVAERLHDQINSLKYVTENLCCVQGAKRDDLRKAIVDLPSNLTVTNIKESFEMQFQKTAEFIGVLVSITKAFATEKEIAVEKHIQTQTDLVTIQHQHNDERERLQDKTKELRNRNEHLVNQIKSLTESKYDDDDKHTKSISVHVEQYEKAQILFDMKIQELVSAHEKVTCQQEETVDKLHVQLTNRDKAIDKLQTEHAKLKREYGLKIGTLTESNVALTTDLERLRDRSKQHELTCSADLDSAMKENETLNQELNDTRKRNTELTVALDRQKIETDEIVRLNKTLQQELVFYENDKVQFLNLKSTLESLGQYLNVDVKRGHVNVMRDIQDNQSASVCKIEALLKRHCVKVPVDDDDGILQDQDMSLDCQLFKDYETQILSIVRTLNMEQSLMDVAESTVVRAHKTPTKRKNAQTHVLTSNSRLKQAVDEPARKTCNYKVDSIELESLKTESLKT